MSKADIEDYRRPNIGFMLPVKELVQLKGSSIISLQVFFHTFSGFIFL